MATAAPLGPPPPVPAGFAARVRRDLAAERAAAPLPRGDASFSLRRTHEMVVSPLRLLLDAYDRHGPVFSLRILHGQNVFVLGPEANHHVLVANAANFRWRDGGFADLIPLLGNGMLTIDGEWHRRDRRALLPAFHRERLEAATAVIHEEADAAVRALAPGRALDLHAWTRRVALRVAMRALLGMRPGTEEGAASAFEQALAFYGREYAMQALRGPGTPWAHMRAARRRLDALLLAEIARRRADRGEREDLLALLLDAGLTDREVRDEAMTLLFAGHDTTTATLSFLVHALARHPVHDARVAEAARRAGERPGYATLMGGGVPELDMAVDETLRLYPPAWIGPRRAVDAFEVCGVRVPGGVPVNYSSWASHRLPDVWEDPDAFVPERFAPERRERIPRGAYVPFGGGSRTCLGMRFGLLEVKVLAARILRDLRPELPAGHRLRVRRAPTLGPAGGLPVVLHAR